MILRYALEIYQKVSVFLLSTMLHGELYMYALILENQDKFLLQQLLCESPDMKQTVEHKENLQILS